MDSMPIVRGRRRVLRGKCTAASRGRRFSVSRPLFGLMTDRRMRGFVLRIGLTGRRCIVAHPERKTAHCDISIYIIINIYILNDPAVSF